MIRPLRHNDLRSQLVPEQVVPWALAALLALAGCAPQPGPKVTTIRFWAMGHEGEVVRSLADHGACNCGTFAVPVAKSTLSHHLRVLREAGLTLTEPTGTQRVVSLRRADLDERFPGLLDAVLGAAAVPA